MKKIKLTEQDLYRIIRTISEQVDEEYYKISPEDYLDLLEKTSYNTAGLSRIKTFQKKPLWITGNLNVSKLPIDNLGNIKVVSGDLDISYTKISNISGINVTGDVRDWDTPIAKRRLQQIEREKYESANERRKEGVWDRTNEDMDDEGLKANALFQFLVGEGDIQALTDDDIAEIDTLQNRSDSLTERFAETQDPEETNRLRDEISEIDEKIDELREGKIDVYSIVPSSYSFYSATQFEVLGLDRSYGVGNETEMDESAYEYVEGMFDDIGVEGYRQSFLEDHIDVDSLVSYVEDWFEDDVRDSPESYFSDDDYQLTEEQEERIEQLENEISKYEERLSEYEEDSPEYEQIQEHLEALQEELDGIEVDTEPTEEMIDRVVQDKIEDIKYDPLSYINDMGLNLADFIDKEGLIKAVVEEDGYGVMSSYDGSVDEERIGGETYYIIRTE